LHEGELLAIFPLHDDVDLNELADEWYNKSCCKWPWDLPTDKIKGSQFHTKRAKY